MNVMLFARRSQRKFRHLLVLVWLSIPVVMAADQPVPGILAYQGSVSDNGSAVTGPVSLKLALVNAGGTVTFWSNDGSSVAGSEPTAAVVVQASQGVFTVSLGDTATPNMTASVPSAVFGNADVRLRRWVAIGGGGTFTLLSPDVRLHAVGYALKAQTVSDGSVTNASLAASSVTADKLASGTIDQALPNQSGHAGQALLTDGATVRWGSPFMPWLQVKVGDPVTAAANTGYVVTSPAVPTITLPASASVGIGDIVRIVAAPDALGWSIGLQTGQTLRFSSGTDEIADTAWTPRESIRNWFGAASSADGTKLYAGDNGGLLYASVDGGVTWTPHDSNRQWASIACSDDGVKVVATAFNGQIYTSTDSGVTWTPRDSVRLWRGVASSADGTKLIAASGLGQLYTSTDSGVTWQPREDPNYWYGVASSADGSTLLAAGLGTRLYVSVDSGVTWQPTESNRQWLSLACSADGNIMIAGDAGVGSDGGHLYTSTDRGVTWTRRYMQRTWYDVACSADGKSMVATEEQGRIHRSTDGGLTWHPLESNRRWLSIASSASGTRLLAAHYGGRLYTANLVVTPTGAQITGSATSVLTGTPGSSIEVMYTGNDQWVSLSVGGVVSWSP